MKPIPDGKPVGGYRTENFAWNPRKRDAILTPIREFDPSLFEDEDEDMIHWYGTEHYQSDLGVDNHGLRGVSLEEILAAGFTHVHTLSAEEINFIDGYYDN